MLSSVVFVFASLLLAVKHTEQWITSAIALAIAFIVWRLMDAVIERFYARRFVSRFIPRVSTYKSLSKSLAGALIFYCIGIELLHIWSVNITPALWSATLISAAIAFGAQAIVRDVLTGVFFFFEESYDVGDGIEFTTTNGTIAGTVDAIGLRLTRVIDQQGRIVSIPNGSIVFVTNATRLPSRVGVKIVVPLRADVATLRSKIEQVATQNASDCGIAPATISVRMEDASADAVTLNIEFEAGRTLARKAEAVMRERVLVALQHDGLLPGVAKPQSGAS